MENILSMSRNYMGILRAAQAKIYWIPGRLCVWRDLLDSRTALCLAGFIGFPDDSAPGGLGLAVGTSSERTGATLR